MENLNNSTSTEKAKRRGRIKNDIIIKYYQLKMLMFLPFDDAGVLLSKLIIDDDDKGLRYENLSKDEIVLMKEFEAEVNRNYQKRAQSNPALRVAKMGIAGQAANSKKAFNRYKNNNSSGETDETGGADGMGEAEGGHYSKDNDDKGDKKEQKKLEPISNSIVTKNFIVKENGECEIFSNDEIENILGQYGINRRDLESRIFENPDEFHENWKAGNYKTFEDIVQSFQGRILEYKHPS